MTSTNPTDEQVDAMLADARDHDGDTVIAVFTPPTTDEAGDGVTVEAQLEFATDLIAQMAWEVIRSQMAPAMQTALAPPWDQLAAPDRAKLLEKTRKDIREGAAAVANGDAK